MTREDIVKNAIRNEEWKRNHEKYIKDGLNGMDGYFDYKRFFNDYKHKADTEVMETIIVDAFNNDNYVIGEFEDQVARVLGIEYNDVFNYRTNKYWDEVREIEE